VDFAMNRCAVKGCSGAAWTDWRGQDLCKLCSEAAWVWASRTTTTTEAGAVLEKLAENLSKYGDRTGPQEPNR